MAKKNTKSVYPYRKLINRTSLTHDEWLEWRRKGIGGSDAGAILGFSPYKSVAAVYLDKLGLSEPTQETEIMTQGNYFEDGVARRFADRHPELKVSVNPWILQSKAHPCMIADIDREIVKSDGVHCGLEIKCPTPRNKANFADGEIPETWYAQVLHYMAVMGFREYYLAICQLSVGYTEFHFFLDAELAVAEGRADCYEVPLQQSEIDALIAAEEEFWNDYVVKNVYPPADGTVQYSRAYSKTVLSDKDLPSIDLTAVSDEIMRYVTLNERMKELEHEREVAKQHVMVFMGASEKGFYGNTNVSFAPQSRQSIDMAKLAREYPEAYLNCQKVTTSRVFRVTSKRVKDEEEKNKKLS